MLVYVWVCLGVGLLYVCTLIFKLCFCLSQDLQAATVNPDPSLKEFEGATLRYASLKLRCVFVKKKQEKE